MSGSLFLCAGCKQCKDALELSLEKYPDLILSDIMMPQMDGLELCSRVKQDLQLGHIPVVLMTAKSMVVHIKEGFSVGADDYIVKPFSMDVLICRINSLLESREKLKKLLERSSLRKRWASRLFRGMIGLRRVSLDYREKYL